MADRSIDLVARIGQLLMQRGWTLSVAESCTGGLVGHLITELSGSSTFFLGGVIAYANGVKQNILGVPEETLRTHGAVSHPTAVAMAQGVRRFLGTDASIAVTGIAGPTGGTPQKPVGTVYIAVSSPLGDDVRHYRMESDRSGNKWHSAEAALLLLEEQLS